MTQCNVIIKNEIRLNYRECCPSSEDLFVKYHAILKKNNFGYCCCKSMSCVLKISHLYHKIITPHRRGRLVRQAQCRNGIFIIFSDGDAWSGVGGRLPQYLTGQAASARPDMPVFPDGLTKLLDLVICYS